MSNLKIKPSIAYNKNVLSRITDIRRSGIDRVKFVENFRK